MRYLIILLLSFTFVSNAQDIEPTPFKFDWDGSGTDKVMEIDSFPQTEFMIGFQWSGRANFVNALGHNTKLNGSSVNTDDTGELQNTLDVLTQTKAGLRNMFCYKYEPTLLIKDSELGLLQTRTDDLSHPIMGFKNIVGDRLTDSTDDNYSRLLLNSTLADTGDVLVLSDRWPKEIFRTNENGSQAQTGGGFGKIWYLAINLKRNDTDNSYGNDEVLSIKLPIKRHL